MNGRVLHERRAGARGLGWNATPGWKGPGDRTELRAGCPASASSRIIPRRASERCSGDPGAPRVWRRGSEEPGPGGNAGSCSVSLEVPAE